MTELERQTSIASSKAGLLALLCAFLFAACALVLRPFITSIAWAGILAYAVWPAFRALRERLGAFRSLAPLLVTVVVSCAFVLPTTWLVVLAQGEIREGYTALMQYLAQGPHVLPAGVANIPWIGEQLQQGLDRYTADPNALARELGGMLQDWASQLAGVVGGVGRYAGQLAVSLLTLYFLFRDGEALALQWRRIVRRAFDRKLDPYLHRAGVMVRAVLYGSIVTAMAQGAIAGLGYYLVGVRAPALLAALTGLLSVIPLLGTALVWGPIAAWLLITHHLWQGVVLAAWGFVLVHPTDNVLRPLLISNASRVPFILVMLGALGGLAGMGVIGAFIGPVLLGTASAVWREWSTELTSAEPT